MNEAGKICTSNNHNFECCESRLTVCCVFFSGTGVAAGPLAWRCKEVLRALARAQIHRRESYIYTNINIYVLVHRYTYTYIYI